MQDSCAPSPFSSPGRKSNVCWYASSAEKIALCRATGQIFREDDELFTETNWAAVIMGQGIAMDGHNQMAASIAADGKVRGELDEIERSVRFVTHKMPAHGDYLARYCPAT